jgi:bis(5'-nucleosyl)-tetraphosphatase (symmetrical)
MTLYAIGDVQGCRAAFDTLLRRIDFDPEADRLWLVGDLVNRGPDSLGVLRRVMELGPAATCVLGNHDLHLLAVVAGARASSEKDTFGAVLRAPDVGELVEWLRSRPLLHHDAAARRVLVHAGIPPRWNVDQAAGAAREVESLLRSDRWQAMLRTMYGNQPAAWRTDLAQEDRCRYTINALTRMRFVDRRGGLDLTHSGPPGSQPADLQPWFDVPNRAARDTHIVFGHWAALGWLDRDDVTALDTGCVWGGALSALPLEPRGAAVRVTCGATA